MTIKNGHSDQKQLGTEAQGRIFMEAICDPGRMRRIGSSMQGLGLVVGRKSYLAEAMKKEKL